LPSDYKIINLYEVNKQINSYNTIGIIISIKGNEICQ